MKPIKILIKDTEPSVNGFVSAKCPVHTEKTPSLLIKNMRSFRCLGCGIRGTAKKSADGKSVLLSVVEK